MHGEKPSNRRRKKKSKYSGEIMRMFGDNISFLSQEEAGSASDNERLISVWPLIIKTATRFHNNLSQHERKSADLEDIIGELAVEILNKSSKFDCKRGTFAAFVSSLIHNRLLGFREEMHVVCSPKNSTNKLREYDRECAAGTQTEKKKQTNTDIVRSMAPYDNKPVEDDTIVGEESPEDFFVASEEITKRVDRVSRAIQTLTPGEAYAVSVFYGLWGTTNQGNRKNNEVAYKAIEKLKETSDEF